MREGGGDVACDTWECTRVLCGPFFSFVCLICSVSKSWGLWIRFIRILNEK